jgi:hypothetical protein
MTALRDTKGLVFLAARRVGCDPDTIYTRAKRSPEVARCIAAQRGEIVDTGEMRLFEAVDRGDPWAVALVLKTLGRERGYVESTRIEGAGKGGEVVIAVLGPGLSAGDL